MRKLAIIFTLFFAVALQAAQPHRAVARMWRGRVPHARADEYQKYLMDAGVAKLKAIKDNMGVDVLRHDGKDETEFIVISYWPNRDAIRAYAGADIEKVHELPRDREFLIDAPGTLTHYDIVETQPAQ